MESERAKEAIDIKRQGVERAFDMAKKQLNEKIASLNEVIVGEKETRDMWIERYEKESRERTSTESQLLQAKSDLKDLGLSQKDTQIKLSTSQRLIQNLQEQNKKFQHEANEAIAKAEGLDRELLTQKEILKQMELTKKEYIQKLKDELDTIEVRYQHLINQNAMLGEDYRSQGYEAFMVMNGLREAIAELKSQIEKLNEVIKQKDRMLVNFNEIVENHEMIHEEDLTRYSMLYCEKELLNDKVANQKLHLEEKTKLIAKKNAKLKEI